ncbi:MAG: sugar phosphate nucleotidyltransferase [Chlamydiales bacterium]
MVIHSPSEALSHESQSQTQLPSSQIPLDRVAVIVLGGGEGKRLFPLTASRCKPAISFGGRYSLIDVPISHSLSSGLNKIFVIGQYLTYSLQKHLFQTYLFQGVAQNYIQLLAPEERKGEKVWYKGTADSIRQNIDYFSEISADYFLILSGDQLYNINFQKMIQFAFEVDAGMLIAAQPVNEKEAKRMGVLKIEQGGSRLIDFYEKPQNEETLHRFYTDAFTLNRLGYNEGAIKNYLGSMGIYFFKRQVLFDLLHEDQRADFGHHLIETEMNKKDAHVFLYDGYWEDIGTIESYYHANLALTRHGDDQKKGLQCYDESSLILTKRYNLPGAKVSNCKIDHAILCEGAILEGAEISHSIIGVRAMVGKGTVIRDSIVMGNEYYSRSAGETRVEPHIGENCMIQKAIIDENVTIGNNVKLINSKNHTDFESSDGRIIVRDGIIVVPRGTIIPDGYIVD